MKTRQKGLVIGGIVLAVVALGIVMALTIVLPRLRGTSASKSSKRTEQTKSTSSGNKVVLEGTLSKRQAGDSAAVSFDTAGTVGNVLVVDGQEIKEGDVLLTVFVNVSANDSGAVEAARAKLNDAQTEYSSAQANYESVKSSCDWAIQNYEDAHRDWEAMYAVWKMNMNDYEAAVADAEWRRENAPDDWDENGNPVAYIHATWPGDPPVEPSMPGEVSYALEEAEGWLNSAAYAVDVAQTELNDAEASSSMTEEREVKAPASGKVSSLRVASGMEIDPQNAEPMLVIVATDKSEAFVDATVQEGDGSDLTLGEKIQVTFPDVEGLELPATVRTVSSTRVELELVGDDERLADGMQAQATIVIQKEENTSADLDREGVNDASKKTETSDGTASGSAAKVDVSHVDYDVAAMSEDEAFQFMHDFTNRTPDEHVADFGKVIRIKGTVSRYAKMENGEEAAVSYSVGVEGSDGVMWSVNFCVEGWEPDDYPPHNGIVEVTGVYGEVEGYGTNAGKTLICNAEDVKVIE